MARAVDYAALPTEQANPRSRDLDRRSVPQILRLMNREDATVSRAVRRAIPQIASAVAAIVERLRAGGRLIFVGAGTSGRLGVIEAAECPPTFSTPPSMVQAIIAGGRGAVFRSREGAEDNRLDGHRQAAARVRRGDVAVGIAASGVTPFVAAALAEAKRLGAITVLVTCAGAPISAKADIVINPRAGPELITGSTRLKAGTATKLVLNMLTVSSMVRLGKVHGNLMVDVRPTSRKLRARAQRIVQQLAGVSEPAARHALRRTDGNTVLAILFAARSLPPAEARQRLRDAGGSLRRVLGANRHQAASPAISRHQEIPVQPGSPERVLRLWSFQSKQVARQLLRNRPYTAQWRHVYHKWRPFLRWMTLEMEARGISVKGRAPIWAWHSCGRPNGRPTLLTASLLLSDRELQQGIEVVELLVPGDQCLLSSYRRWNELFDRFLDSRALPDQASARRLFHVMPIQPRDDVQAALPRIDPSWVVAHRPLRLRPGDDGFDPNRLA